MIDDIYLDKVFEALEGKFGEKRQYDIKKRLDWIISKVTGKEVLDIGCSQGALEFELLRTMLSQIHITGVDSASESIDYANAI